MRTFEDRLGAVWDVAVDQESYGTLVLMFSQRKTHEVRRLILETSSRLEAERLLTGFSAECLNQKLGAARPWSATESPSR